MVTLTPIIDLSDLQILPGQVSEEELKDAWNWFKLIKNTCTNGVYVFSNREDFISFCKKCNYKT